MNKGGKPLYMLTTNKGGKPLYMYGHAALLWLRNKVSFKIYSEEELKNIYCENNTSRKANIERLENIWKNLFTCVPERLNSFIRPNRYYQYITRRLLYIYKKYPNGKYDGKYYNTLFLEKVDSKYLFPDEDDKNEDEEDEEDNWVEQVDKESSFPP